MRCDVWLCKASKLRCDGQPAFSGSARRPLPPDLLFAPFSLSSREEHQIRVNAALMSNLKLPHRTHMLAAKWCLEWQMATKLRSVSKAKLETMSPKGPTSGTDDEMRDLYLLRDQPRALVLCVLVNTDQVRRQSSRSIASTFANADHVRYQCPKLRDLTTYFS